jgi:hypothetical protein
MQFLVSDETNGTPKAGKKVSQRSHADNDIFGTRERTETQVKNILIILLLRVKQFFYFVNERSRS